MPRRIRQRAPSRRRSLPAGRLPPRGRPWTRTTPAASRSPDGRAAQIPLGLAALVISVINFHCIADMRITAIASCPPFPPNFLIHHRGGDRVITYVIIVGLGIGILRSFYQLGTMDWPLPLLACTAEESTCRTDRILKSLMLIGPHKIHLLNSTEAIMRPTAPFAILKLVSGSRRGRVPPVIGAEVTTNRRSYANIIGPGTTALLARVL